MRQRMDWQEVVDRIQEEGLHYTLVHYADPQDLPEELEDLARAYRSLCTRIAQTIVKNAAGKVSGFDVASIVEMIE